MTWFQVISTLYHLCKIYTKYKFDFIFNMIKHILCRCVYSISEGCKKIGQLIRPIEVRRYSWITGGLAGPDCC